MVRRKLGKGLRTFLLITALFSALGLIGIISKGFFNIDISETITNLSVIILGVGLTVLGSVTSWGKFFRDGRLDGEEIGKIFIGTLGLIIIVITSLGLLDLSFIPEETVLVIQGIAAALLLILIVFQTSEVIRG